MKNFILFLMVIGILFGTFTWVYSARKAINFVAFGDSITYGTGDPSKQGYVERVKVNLEKKWSSTINVSNFAIPKYTTNNVLEQMRDKKIMKQIESADYLMLYIGTNDFRKSASYQFQHLNKNDLNYGKAIFSKNFKQILEIMRSSNSSAPIMVLGLFQPYVEYQNNEEIQMVIEEWNNEMVRVISDFEHAYFVPTLALFQGKPKKKYFADSLHPNANGYIAIANRLEEEIVKLELKNMN